MIRNLNVYTLIFFVICTLAGCAGTTALQRFPDDSRGLSRETGRAFLVESQMEAPEYGLYSYFLLGSPPSSDIARKRYLQAITDYMNIIGDVSEFAKDIPRRELNITYLPLNLPPPPAPSAEWILNHYNYARARSLLRILKGELWEGPYIISTLHPLSTIKTTPDKYLLQNMSSVPPHVISFWVKEFIKQASGERFWEEDKIRQLELNLRTEIGIYVEALSEVKKAEASLKEMITLVETR